MAGAAALKTLTIGSRGSKLALWQARYIASQLDERGVPTRIEIIKTSGDIPAPTAPQTSGKGLFTKEIEDALLSGAIDAAVHSLKDLPVDLPRSLVIAATPLREDPRDAIVGCRFRDLPQRARVGTSSGRRAAQLLLLRPDLQIAPIRGNVDTRLRKLKERQYEAIVLAVAGLRRLALEREIAEIFSPGEICPAAGQGALAIETRQDHPAREICAALNDHATSRAVACERAAVRVLGGGCQLPVGAFAEIVDGVLRVAAIVISADGKRHLKANAEGSPEFAEEIGRTAGEELVRCGARAILDESK